MRFLFALFLAFSPVLSQDLSAQGFLSEVSHPVGTFPVRVAVADLDGNGLPDIVTANENTGDVSVLLAGPGGVYTHSTVGGGGDPVDVALVDFDSNGTIDLITCNGGERTVSVHPGLGDGTFGPPQVSGLVTPSAFARTIELVVTDLDGNGDPDVVVVNDDFLGSSITVLLGDGAGGVGAPSEFSAPAKGRALAAGDLDLDGRQDIVVAHHQTDLVSVWLGHGDGTFDAPQTFTTGPFTEPRGILVADLDDDGLPDVCTANADSNDVALLKGDGAGGLGRPQLFPAGPGAEGIEAADMDGDGLLDLVVTGESSDSVVILRGGDLLDRTLYVVGGSPEGIAVADLDGDGRLDMVTANTQSDDVSLVLADGAGGYRSGQNFIIGTSSPADLALGDVDGDGRLDVVTADGSGDSISTLLADGAGTLGPPIVSPIGFIFGSPTIVDVSLGDLDGDGSLDAVAAAFSDEEVYVMIGDGAGSFTELGSEPAGDRPAVVEIADIDLDGRLDVIVANANGDDLSVFLGDGAGGLVPAPGVLVGERPSSLGIADLDVDGWPDLVTANAFGGDLSIVLGDGTGGFSAATSLAVPGIPQDVAIADLDGNGTLDLAVADSVQAAHVLSGDGTGGFALSASYSVGFQPTSLTAADLDGDGVLDLAVADNQPVLGTLSVLAGAGDGSFGTPVVYRTGTGAKRIEVGEFSGDGRPDLVTLNGFPSVTLLRNDASFPPSFGDDTPCGQTLMASVGAPVSFTVEASTAVQGGLVTLTVDGLPAGAVLDPALPLTGPSVSTTFSWIPDNGALGTHVVGFEASTGGDAVSCAVTLEVAECFLFVGAAPGADEVEAGGHVFQTQLSGVSGTWGVTMEDGPSFPVASLPVFPLRGGSSGQLGGQGGLKPHAPREVFSVQVVMWNPWVFPAKPAQWSPVLTVSIDPWGAVETQISGTSEGIQLEASTSVIDDTVWISFPFSIDGL